MNVRFWKYYALIVIAIVLISLGIEGLFSSARTEATSYWVPLRETTCLLIENAFCAHEDMPTLQALDTSALHLSEARQDELRKNSLFGWRLDSGKITYVLRDRQGRLYQLGPFSDPAASEPNDLFLYLIFFGSIALLLLFLMLPTFRDLLRLQDHIQRLAHDEKAFPVRLREQSLLAPIVNALNRTITQVRQLLEAQKETTNFIAHDIRTPIARMRFTLALLPAGAEDLKQQLRADLHELEAIATHYLDFARQEALNPVLQLSRVRLDELLAPLLAGYAQAHPALAIAMDCPAPLWVHADAFSLSRAVDNLLANATRYARGRILLRIRAAHGACRLTLDDDGEGVPREAQRALLKPFSQAEGGRGQREKGFGLGLYIVVRTSLLHGGRARIQSAPKLQGARIALCWPDRP